MESGRERRPARAVTLLAGTGGTVEAVAGRLWDAGHAIRIGAPFDPVFDGQYRRYGASEADALRDVFAVYLESAVTGPAADDAFARFARLAVRSGVRRIVLVTGDERDGQSAERVLESAGLDWTILRCGRCERVGEAAELAFEALTTSAHAGSSYDLTEAPALPVFDATVPPADFGACRC